MYRLQLFMFIGCSYAAQKQKHGNFRHFGKSSDNAVGFLDPVSCKRTILGHFFSFLHAQNLHNLYFRSKSVDTVVLSNYKFLIKVLKCWRIDDILVGHILLRNTQKWQFPRLWMLKTLEPLLNSAILISCRSQKLWRLESSFLKVIFLHAQKAHCFCFQDGTRYQQSENGVANCDLSRVCWRNLVNFGPQKAKNRTVVV